MFAIGAFGSPQVFTATYSTTTAYYDPGGAYWYRYPSYKFGFVDFSSVNLNSCDYGQGSNDCVSRLCWHLDGYGGGSRAGCTTDLYYQTWRKVIYKENNSSAMCNPGKSICLHYCCILQNLTCKSRKCCMSKNSLQRGPWLKYFTSIFLPNCSILHSKM